MVQIEEASRAICNKLDTADRQEPSEALKTKTSRLRDKIERLKEEMQRLLELQACMLATHHYTNEENGLRLRRYWSTAACAVCPMRQCTPSKERRITRWKHEHLVEEVQRRLDANPDAMRTRRETVEHPFGTIKARMGATHFLMKRLHNVAAEMALHVLSYNLTRVMNIMGVQPLLGLSGICA